MIKYGFLDFDDTTCIHTKHMRPEEFRKNKIDLVIDDKCGYYLNDCKSSKAMKNLLEELKVKSVPCYCLTWADHSGWVKPKKVFLDTMYPGCFEDVIVTSSREAKIEYIKLFAEAMGCGLDEILLVEDHPDTLNLALAEGISIMSAMEVTVRYDY